MSDWDSENATTKRKWTAKFGNEDIENSNANSPEDVSRSKSKVARVTKARSPLMTLSVNPGALGSSSILFLNHGVTAGVSSPSESPTTSSGDEVRQSTFFKNLSCCATLSEGVWEEICSADLQTKERVDPSYFNRHPNLLPHYRAILLDWLIEVCDLYNLSRDTFYLTVDYLDRYLTRASDFPRDKLQMLGITCLMVASKIEEIKPMPIDDLLYISDNSCTFEEVIKTEREVLESLDWTRTLWTTNRWLYLYLHMLGCEVDPETFSLATKLLDLSTLDVDSLRFSYRVLAATSLRLTSVDIPFRIAPDSHLDMTGCSVWMSIYWEVIQNNAVDSSRGSSSGGQHCRVFRNVNLNQKYGTFMCMYEEAKDLIEIQRSLPSSPLSCAEN